MILAVVFRPILGLTASTASTDRATNKARLIPKQKQETTAAMEDNSNPFHDRKDTFEKNVEDGDCEDVVLREKLRCSNFHVAFR
jgi:hypothetical protein